MQNSEPTPSPDVAEFLQEQDRKRRRRQATGRRIAKYRRMEELSDAAEQLWKALPSTTARPSINGRAGVVEALLAFVNRCRELDAGDRLGDLALDCTAYEPERLARALFATAVAGDRATLLQRVEEILGRGLEQATIWSVVVYIAGSIVRPRQPSAPPASSSETSPVDSLGGHLLADANPDRGQRPPSPAGNGERGALDTSHPCERVTLDPDSRTITFDGVAYPGLDPAAFLIFEQVWKARPRTMSSSELLDVPGLRRKKVSREIKKLPEPLRALLEGNPGSGYTFRLPPRSRPQLSAAIPEK